VRRNLPPRQSGGQVSEVLAVNPFFPPMMKHMVKAGETTGNVDGMMGKIADFYDTSAMRRWRRSPP